MERSNFFGDQLVLADDLNNVSTSMDNQVTGRSIAGGLAPGGWGKSSTLNSSSVAYGGIFGNPADYLNANLNFHCLDVFPDSIAVAPGKALSPDGELIVNPSILSVDKDVITTTGRWTSSPSVANYVKLSYQETSGSLKANDIGTLFPTRYAGSFLITVNSIPPNANEILLSQFMADGSGDITGGMIDKRLYERHYVMADAVMLDPTVKPVSSLATVEDHVRAVGTGTPTPVNPHGLSLADLGGVADQVGSHRKFEHVPGIFFTGAKTAAAVQSYSASITNAGGFDVFIFTAPTNAALSAAGGLYSGSLPSLSTSTLPSTGSFDVMATLSGTTIWQAAALTNETDLNANSNLVWLVRATVTATTIVPSSVQDKRQFYTIAPDAIRGDRDETTAITALSTVPTLAENLNRMRYMIGKALTGTGSMWAGSNPLTAGPTSNADDYHTHAVAQFGQTLKTTGSVGSDAFNPATNPMYYFDRTYQNPSGSAAFINATCWFLASAGSSHPQVDVYIGPTYSAPLASCVATIGWENDSLATETNQLIASTSFLVPAGWFWQLSTSGSFGIATPALQLRLYNLAIWY